METNKVQQIITDELSDYEKRIINIIRNLKPYDVLEVSLQKNNDKILQIICRNTIKETFPLL
jgi:hypothetical protein